MASDWGGRGGGLVEQSCKVGGTEAHLDPLGNDLVLTAEDRAAAAVLQLVGVILGLFAYIERHPDQAGLGEGVISDQAIDPVWHQHADPVSRYKPAPQQPVAEPVRQAVEFAKRNN